MDLVPVMRGTEPEVAAGRREWRQQIAGILKRY